MLNGLFQLIDGTVFQRVRFNCIANNLANINSSGFKRDFISFDKRLSDAYMSRIDFHEGLLRPTGNSLDLAFSGNEGFFKVMTKDGIRYTRSGSFSINSEGLLVTRNNDPVLGERGTIRIEEYDVVIDEKGNLSVKGGIIDRIAAVDFEDRSLLQKAGLSYFLHPAGESAEKSLDDPGIKQGFLEMSNVNPTEEMIKMMENFRSFEAAQKAIQALDEVTRKTVNDYAMQQ